MTDIPVLIVGGGPVGLALACDLGWRGVSCLLVEQGDGVVGTPKMNEVNIRSMEFCRRWGITADVDSCPFPADYPLDVVTVTESEAAEVYERRLVLVRPDGHVAWRADSEPSDPPAMLDRVRGA
ncbi:MAG: hypothetical protein A3H32_16570 [Betaproteobacteria bacterium RIFCSPLOWO2_02_FULL_63_19]|nr:MAG: hypothetical protein A3H32_16570 [Betaproteobacteria bacterium RIFCSPLOWO2_02_FULL_63_19]